MKPTTRAGLIFSCILALETLAAWALATGRLNLPQSAADQAVGACLGLCLGLTCLGLFWGRRFGWYAGLAYLVGTLLDGVRTSIIDPEFGFHTLFALGLWLGISGLLLSVLDARPLRDALRPTPPAWNLPWKPMSKLGLALAGISLIGSIWGFLILGVWLALMAWTHRRRQKATEPDSGDFAA